MTSTSDRFSTSADQAITEIYRSEWGRLLSVLVTRTRRLDLAEDALSEAFARASTTWRSNGVPSNPAGWLYTTAYRQIIAGLRSEAIRGRKAPLLAVGTTWPPSSTPADAGDDEMQSLGDERLALILLCCHPALSVRSRSPLALRLVIGTNTAEIARLFLVPTATMAARITRAKKKITTAGIPLAAPADQELRLRLDDVCRTIYVAFTAGYTPGSGAKLLRTDLAGEARELASVLGRLVPEAPQVKALNALLLLQHARRDAREHDGKLVTLTEQDRTRWHHGEIAAGQALLRQLPASDGYAEELRLQAMIAAEHAGARSASNTAWGDIAAHYEQLELLTRSPIVRLNRAVAVAEHQGPDAGLALLDRLEEHLPASHRVHAVRADLARRAGNVALAQASYNRAIELCTNDVERTFLSSQLLAMH